MNSKKWIIQYLEVLLDIIVMFTSYLIANWYKFGFFRTGLYKPYRALSYAFSGGARSICGSTFRGICR